MKVIGFIVFFLSWICATVVVAMVAASLLGGLAMFIWMTANYGPPETSAIVILSIFCAFVGLGWVLSDLDKKTKNRY